MFIFMVSQAEAQSGSIRPSAAIAPAIRGLAKGGYVMVVMINAAPRSIWRINFAILRRRISAWVRDPRQFSAGRLPRFCPICGYDGVMIAVGHPPRWDARCASCGSRERHRLLWLWATEGGLNRLADKRILHFAPEKALRQVLRNNPRYETADLLQRSVTHQVDIMQLPMASETYDVVIANHVLEHIDDDRSAMQEMFRVLRPGGIALLTAPINPTRQETYEDAGITDPVERQAHFNAPDHRRFYGLDFADRLQSAGFSVETFRLTPAEEVRYGLLPMEWLYVAARPMDALDRQLPSSAADATRPPEIT